MTIAAPEAAPLLRTLSPALRGLERSLRAWLDGPHRARLSAIRRAELQGCADDLQRGADALDVERPLLVVMLMGGTGVGKSTLLNALAGGSIAQASFQRPTTRDPVVYYHQSMRTDRIAQELRHCRLIPHDRPALEHKVLVDTPDLDSNDLANREKLLAVLPVADVVLYVGSQEKYHDQIGWELFLKQRRRKAFAFVLNKWDRCLHPLASGLRPDEDLLKDLKKEGFESPLLFRTNAQFWVDRSAEDNAPVAAVAAAAEQPAEGNHQPASQPVPTPVRPEPPEGEQFLELVEWLEMGLNRLEIEAIKARGVSQLLRHLDRALEQVKPPDLTETAERVRAAWEKPLTDDASATTDVLINTIDPFQREIEHHFALEGQRRFYGPMAWYLNLFTRFRYVGSTLRDRLPFVPKSRGEPPPPAWDLGMFTRACSDGAANRQLDARGKALANRLLVEADLHGFPVELLTDPVESTARLDWRQRYAQILHDVLQQVERRWTQPTGSRRYLHSVLVFLANWLPPLTFISSLVFVLIRIYDPWGQGQQQQHSIWDLLIPFVATLAMLMIMHVLISIFLPLRWRAIREEFRKQLGLRLQQELDGAYGPLTAEAAAALLAERRQVEKLIGETREVAAWLEQREQSASIAGLYGN
jgi:hypothetical protein